MADEIRYKNSSISVDKLQQAVERILEDASSSDEANQIAKRHGKGEDFLSNTELKKLIEIRREGQGLSPETTEIIVAFAPLAVVIAKDIWTNFVLPRLKRQFGEDALLPK